MRLHQTEKLMHIGENNYHNEKTTCIVQKMFASSSDDDSDRGLTPEHIKRAQNIKHQKNK
jgi:hypothetical protein